MPDARRRQIEQVCETALAAQPEARAAFLDEACAGDAVLRREVESLLAQESRADAFLEVPLVDRADANAADRMVPPREPLPQGTRLGPYEIEALIGTGGMGEVYRARDTRLGRTVALKILPEGLAADPDRRRRFEHEAHAASALNHPHICALFDVGEAVPSTPASRVPLAAPQPEAPRPGEGGNPVSVSYLVMEHLDGETLAARIARGPLPIPDVLAYGAQIADALSAAHRGGIIHRDLKPANVMLTGSGVHRNIAGAVKLLDFGLAKLKGAAGAGVTADAFGAAPALMTTPGQIVGTLPYMAPEQVEGRDADGRTDIWVLGAMLYEMVTGARAFQAPTSASLTAAILEHEPAPISSTQPLTPPSLDRLIRKCLAKDPDERWQSARDVAGELRWMLAPAGNDAATSMAPRRGRRLWPGLAAAGIIVATMIGAGATWLLRRPCKSLRLLASASTSARPST